MASGDGGRANWKDPELYKLFIDLCLKESTENGKNGGSLKKESWDRVRVALNEEKNVNLSQKQLKNQWEYLKSNYGEWSKIISKTGNGYDPVTNTVNWSTEEWSEYIQGAVGALDGTLILAVVPPDQQVPYRGRGKGECYQNVLAICDFDMLFTFVWAGWEGVAHDSRVLRETMSDLANNFSILPLVPNRDRLDSFLLERTCSACAEMSNPAGDCKGSPRTFGEPWPQFNDGLIYRDTVKASDSGLTLIDFYSSKHLNSAPLQGWLQRIRNGQIRIDGSVVTDPSTALRAGSELNYHRLPWKEPDTPYLLQVLFEDNDLIALNKPSGLQVLPGGLFQQRTVLTQLQGQASKHSSSLARQEPHPVPVHRLGRGTSGILLCAKTKVAKTRLSAYFADGTLVVRDNSDSSAVISTRKIGKIYRAMVSGILDEDEVVIKQPIGLVRYPGVANGLYVACPSGKPALSKVKVLERNVQGNYMLVEVEIQSGRPHQIRIHLSFIGHPLIGDPLYVAGGQPNCFDPEFENESFAHDGGYQRPGKPVPGDCGYLLHAHKVVLPHPTRSEVIKITAPLPSVLRTQQEVEEIELGAGDEAD